MIAAERFVLEHRDIPAIGHRLDVNGAALGVEGPISTQLLAPQTSESLVKHEALLVALQDIGGVL